MRLGVSALGQRRARELVLVLIGVRLAVVAAAATELGRVEQLLAARDRLGVARRRARRGSASRYAASASVCGLSRPMPPRRFIVAVRLAVGRRRRRPTCTGACRRCGRRAPASAAPACRCATTGRRRGRRGGSSRTRARRAARSAAAAAWNSTMPSCCFVARSRRDERRAARRSSRRPASSPLASTKSTRWTLRVNEHHTSTLPSAVDREAIGAAAILAADQ